MIEKQILDYTDNDFEKLVEKIVKKGSAVLHDQNLTRQQLAEVCSRMGEVEELDYFMNPADSPQISIVSGKIIDGKAIGIFGPTELEWHANGTGRYNFKEMTLILKSVRDFFFKLNLHLLNQRLFKKFPQHKQCQPRCCRAEDPSLEAKTYFDGGKCHA